MKYLGNALRLAVVLIWILLILFFYEMRGHAATPKQPTSGPPWTLGSYINPHQYQVGQILSVGNVHPSRGKTWTIVRWKPAMTPMLYEEYLAFCGEVTGQFVNLISNDTAIIIYSRAIEVTRLDSPPPSIVACRSLDKVQKVQSPKEQN